MKLYHGSTVDIQRIDLAKSKPNKDFGRAFYLSVDEQQAMEMAQFRAEFEDATPVVNVFEFDEKLLKNSAISVSKTTPKNGHISSTIIARSLKDVHYTTMTSSMVR